jgi:hypothetical protein
MKQVPLSQIPTKNQQGTISPGAPHFTSNFSGGLLQPDRDGRTALSFRPSWLMIINMFPFPCMCAGCFCSRCSDLVVDEQRKMISYSSNPGYALCCRKYHDVPFEKVANVAGVRDECCGTGTTLPCQGKFASGHSLTIITTDGTLLPLGDMRKQSDIESDIRALHWFFFGRGSGSAYTLSYLWYDPSHPPASSEVETRLKNDREMY